MPSVKPAPATPNDDIVLMKMFDTAAPKRSWSRLTKGGQCDSHQYSIQQRQNYFFHCCISLEDFCNGLLTVSGPVQERHLHYLDG
jgi:hypothetical protein